LSQQSESSWLPADTIFFTGSTISTGVRQLGENRVTIFPNPVTTEVTISFGTASSYKVQLTNSLGELLEQTQINSSSHTLDISSRPKGIYFITAIDEEGNKAVRKIVKM
jgi:hypothetical protein